jgi:hypothetical protein
MRADLDPAQMTPNERFQEVAAIFATGLLRLRDRTALSANPAEPHILGNLATASFEPLDLSAERSVTVHAG